MPPAQALLLDFLDALRAAGVPVDVGRIETFLAAAHVMPGEGLYGVHLVGRATLCASPGDVARYDACFARFFFGHETPGSEILPDPEAAPKMPGLSGALKKGPRTDDDRDVEIGAASAVEVLRSRKLSALSPEEHALVLDLISRLRGKAALQRGRRRAPARDGDLDIRRTVRAACARGGELHELMRVRRRERPRRRVLLLDVSGSMAPFAPGLLRFGYAACRCARRSTEVFTMGTRLTRVTRFLDAGDPETAILAASRAVPDWSGGTRLGEQLKAFLDLWGQRGMARGAIVVILSDGWERGGAAMLAAQMTRLRNLSRRVIWANPHKSTPGFEPLTQGMRAALPAVDDFVSGSSADEFARLIGLMAEDAGRRGAARANSTIR